MLGILQLPKGEGRASAMFRGTQFALRFAVLTSCLALFAPVAWSQVTTGRIEGFVKDPSGSVIPNAKVSLRNVDTNIDRRFDTGPDGAYSFAAVLPRHC